jgi:hypothetical protein
MLLAVPEDMCKVSYPNFSVQLLCCDAMWDTPMTCATANCPSLR